jgi:hypothetical protein
MSVAVAAPFRVAGDDGRRPDYWVVWRRVLLAEVGGSLCLLAIAAVLSWTSLASVDVSNLSMYAPWLIDGPWSLAASLGWGLLVVALIGSIVRAQVQARTGRELSRGLTFAAVAIGGYGPTVFNVSSAVRLVLTVSVTSALMLVLGFEHSGEPRRLPALLEFSRRRLAVVLPVIAVVLVAPFAVLHPLLSFASLETGAFSSAPNPESQPIYYLRPGGHIQVATAMKPGHLPITVTGARILGTDGVLRVDRVTVSRDSPPYPFTANNRTQLPLRVDAGHALWISAKLTLIRCVTSAVTVSAVQISYRELGLALTQAVSIDQSTTVAGCRF